MLTLTLASAQGILFIHRTQLTPSTAATNDELLLAQTPNNPRAVYNGRPTELTGPCLSIYHPVFQEFMQAYNSPIKVDEITPHDYDLANLLVCSSVKYFRTESDRFLAIIPRLQPYLGKYFVRQGRIESFDKRWTPAGHATVECGLYKEGEMGHKWMHKLILEFKNGVVISDSDVVEQAQRGYALVCTSPYGTDYGASAYPSLLTNFIFKQIDFVRHLVCLLLERDGKEEWERRNGKTS